MMQRTTAKRGRGHSIPPWSAPRESWRTILTKDTTSTRPAIQEQLRRVCVLVRTADRAPLAWCMSWSCPIDKGNDRAGCGRFRLLQIIDPISCVWASGLWKRTERQQAVAQYGFTKRRNRLHALLMIKLMRWILNIQHTGNVSVFF